MDQIKIGQFIKQRRKEQSLTQQQLADKLNISCKTVSKWECGLGIPDPSLMLPLCKELAISVNELLSGCSLGQTEYQQKAEENLVNAYRERQTNKQIIIVCVLVGIATIVSGITLFYLAGFLPLLVWQRILLISIAALTVTLGIIACCILDRRAGYFQCRRCKQLFVPDMKDYVKGVHSLTTRRLKCPHCGKISFCRKKLNK